MAIPKKHVNSTTHDSRDVAELLSKKFGGVSIYAVIMFVLAAAIIWTGIKTAEQVQQYHQDYKALQDMKKQHRKLQVEHQRLLIEQQTFSATPQIASRAVAELGMYSPTLEDKMILQPSAPVVSAETAQATGSGALGAGEGETEAQAESQAQQLEQPGEAQ